MSLVFRKHYLARMGNYVFLLPFVLAYHPLTRSFTLPEILWFSAGLLVILAIIIISNLMPYASLEEDRIILNLHYYQGLEIHYLKRITLLEVINRHSCRIHSRDFETVRIHLNPRDLKKLLEALSQKDVRIKRP